MQLFDTQKAYFSTGITKSYEWRIDQLNRLERLLNENEDVLCNALYRDFKTVYYEQIFEILALPGTIANVKAQLKAWMLPEATELKQALKDTGHKGFIYREPYGVTLIIGPFNAPLILTFEPAIAALLMTEPTDTSSLQLFILLSGLKKLWQEKYLALCYPSYAIVTSKKWSALSKPNPKG